MLLISQIKIFEEFLMDFDSSLTGSFIAKKKRLNQKTTSNYLNVLERESILKSRVQGKNKLYSLNLDNKQIVKNFVVAVEHIRTLNFLKKNILVKEIIEKVNENVIGMAVVFGSYAKGVQKKGSDLDILVIGRCNEKEIDKISKMYKIEINLKIYPEFKEDFLMEEVVKYHIAIKNIEQFIEKILNGKS